MSSSITINSITGTSPYNITLCDNDPINQTCVWIAQITDLDLPYTFTPPISLQYTTDFIVKIADSSAGSCVIIIPPVLNVLNECYPIYVNLTNNQVYSFDPSSYSTSSYFNPSVEISAITRNDGYIWIFDPSAGFIYEYDATGYTTPTLIRSIDTTANSVDIYGMCVYSSTELLALSSTGDINVVDISTNIASTTFMYNVGGTPQSDCNLLRDNNIGITYMKTSLSGLKAFYDDGTEYSSGSWPAGYQKGFFRDSSTAEIYGVGDTGSVYQIQQSPGSISPFFISTISPDNSVSVGVGQSDTCIPSLISPRISLTDATAYTITLTASSFTWFNWGDSNYVSGGTSGTITKSKTYSPSFTGDVTINSYDIGSITGLQVGASTPLTVYSPIVLTNELSKLYNLSYYNTPTYAITSGLTINLPRTLNHYYSYTSNLIGNTSDIPSGITYFYTNNVGVISGGTSNLPQSATSFTIQGGFDITGFTSELPRTLNYFRLTPSGSDNISGSTYDLPSGLTELYLAAGNNHFSGSTSGFPSGMTYIYLNGFDTISGDTSGLPTGLTDCFIANNSLNTISGDTSGLPRSGNTVIYGFNTISGNISNLPYSATSIEINGNNTISGNTSGLPGSINSLIINQNGGVSFLTGNTISGNISGFTGNSLQTIFIAGSNTISGNTSNIPTTPSFINLSLYGNNTLSGDIINIPSNIQKFQIIGNNTLSGNISGLSTSTLRIFDVAGFNTISGSLSGFPSSTGIKVFRLVGGSINLTPGSVSGMVLPSGIGNFLYNPTGSGLNSADIDSVLFAATATTWSTPGDGYTRSITLQGANSAPSAASLLARQALTGTPYNLSVNVN
jgi:hypothetical protein